MKVRFHRAAVFLDRWHWLFLLAGAPWLLFPTPAVSPVLLLVPALWLVAALAGREWLPRTPLNGVMLALAVMLLVSTGATYDVAVSLPKLAGMILGLGTYFALARIQTRRAWQVALGLLLAAGVGVAGLGLVGSHWLDKYPVFSTITAHLPTRLTELPGAEGGFQPNEVAGTLLWITPLSLVLALHAWQSFDWLTQEFGQTGARAWRAGVTLSVPLLGGVLVLSQSRGALTGLGLTVAAGLVGLAARRFGPTGLLAGLLLGAVSLVAGRNVVLAQLVRAGVIAIGPQSISLGTFQGRLDLWVHAIDAIRVFPITGMGMNTFRTLAPVMFPLWPSGFSNEIAHAHDEFLQAALDLGLPGLVAFLAIYVVAARMLWVIWRSAGRLPLMPGWSARTVRLVAMGFGGGLLAHLLFGLTDAVALGAKPGIILWFCLGLVASLHGLLRQSKTATFDRSA
jgi:putative inorganic carbon (HCO3(-)) transporter